MTVHFLRSSRVTACGLDSGYAESEHIQADYDTRSVDCGKCKRTKKFKETDN